MHLSRAQAHRGCPLHWASHSVSGGCSFQGKGWWVISCRFYPTSCDLWLDFTSGKPSLLLSPRLSEGFVGTRLRTSAMEMMQTHRAVLRKLESSSCETPCGWLREKHLSGFCPGGKTWAFSKNSSTAPSCLPFFVFPSWANERQSE